MILYNCVANVAETYFQWREFIFGALVHHVVLEYEESPCGRGVLFILLRHLSEDHWGGHDQSRKLLPPLILTLPINILRLVLISTSSWDFILDFIFHQNGGVDNFGATRLAEVDTFADNERPSIFGLVQEIGSVILYII